MTSAHRMWRNSGQSSWFVAQQKDDIQLLRHGKPRRLVTPLLCCLCAGAIRKSTSQTPLFHRKEGKGILVSKNSRFGWLLYALCKSLCFCPYLFEPTCRIDYSIARADNSNCSEQLLLSACYYQHVIIRMLAFFLIASRKIIRRATMTLLIASSTNNKAAFYLTLAHSWNHLILVYQMLNKDKWCPRALRAPSGTHLMLGLQCLRFIQSRKSDCDSQLTIVNSINASYWLSRPL